MEVRVSGHQVNTGEAFRVHVETRLKGIAEQYFSRALSAHVTLSAGPHASFVCDIVCHVMQGLVLKGSNRASTAHLAFDGAADRIEKQLRRYMRRLKSKNGTALDAVAADMGAADMGVPENADYRIFRAEPEDAEAGDAPLTIAETKVDIPEATVADAVMMLDLRNTTALLFTNLGTGRLNMVYRREDGNIGWVEPRN